MPITNMSYIYNWHIIYIIYQKDLHKWPTYRIYMIRQINLLYIFENLNFKTFKISMEIFKLHVSFPNSESE